MMPYHAICSLYLSVRHTCCTALGALVIGWLWQLSLSPCAAQNTLPTTAEIANNQSSVTVPFVTTLAASGYIPIDVRINGKGPYAFVLDTGARGIIIKWDVAATLDLLADVNVPMVSRLKPEAAAELRFARSLEVGEAGLYNVTLQVFDLPADFPAQGILGADFLAYFVVTADYERRRLTLTLPNRFTYQDQGNRLPFTLDEEHIPTIAGNIAGVSGRFGVITGYNGGLDLFNPFVQKHHLREKYLHRIEYQESIELAGPPGMQGHARANTLRLGQNLAIHNAAIDLMNTTSPLDGIIGSEVLRQFALTLDWPHHQIYLQKNAFYGKKVVFNRAGFIPRTLRSGLEIMWVMANSPAANAGLRVGDHLVEIADQPAQAWTLLKLRDLVCSKPGTKLPLTIERDGRQISVVLTLRDLL